MRKVGNPAFHKGMQSLNPSGRTKDGHLAGGAALAAQGRHAELPITGYPSPRSGLFRGQVKPHYRTFAAQIRAATDDGQELIDAVLLVLRSAMEQGRYELALQAATWLADRGWGRPTQVTALIDAAGHSVAFMLWAPAHRVDTRDASG